MGCRLTPTPSFSLPSRPSITPQMSREGRGFKSTRFCSGQQPCCPGAIRSGPGAQPTSPLGCGKRSSHFHFLFLITLTPILLH